jgi:predicted  nucleic acid-binding Zn-ribbon protein
VVRCETERLHRDVTQLKEQCGELEKHNEELRSQITSQQDVSEAARRLTVQMKKAEEETNRLRNISELSHPLLTGIEENVAFTSKKN